MPNRYPDRLLAVETTVGYWLMSANLPVGRDGRLATCVLSMKKQPGGFCLPCLLQISTGRVGSLLVRFEANIVKNGKFSAPSDRSRSGMWRIRHMRWIQIHLWQSIRGSTANGRSWLCCTTHPACGLATQAVSLLNHIGSQTAVFS